MGQSLKEGRVIMCENCGCGTCLECGQAIEDGLCVGCAMPPEECICMDDIVLDLNEEI